MVEPGILGKKQEESQKVPGKVGTSWLIFPTMTFVKVIYFQCFQQIYWKSKPRSSDFTIIMIIIKTSWG